MEKSRSTLDSVRDSACTFGRAPKRVSKLSIKRLVGEFALPFVLKMRSARVVGFVISFVRIRLQQSTKKAPQKSLLVNLVQLEYRICVPYRFVKFILK